MKVQKRMKQSFTLVELSIVLLILSLLVGSLLVGRKIVDRAKLQRIMFEFDYYKKNFILFQDTFEVLPGNVDVTVCKRYAEFSQVTTEAEKKSNTLPTAGKYCVATASDANTRVVEGYVSASVIASTDNWLPFVTGMRFMKSGKVLDTVKFGIADTITDADVAGASKGEGDIFSLKSPVKTVYTSSGSGSSTTGALEAGEQCEDCISNATVKATQGQASFDAEGAFSFVGVPENVTEMYYIRGSYMSEMQNELYRTKVSGKNVLVLYRNTAKTSDAQGISSTATAILSSTITNMMDVKMDDGQPGTGNMLALKGAYAYSSEGSSHANEVCYNNTFENSGSSFYLDNSDVKYGCNVVYLMSNG